TTHACGAASSSLHLSEAGRIDLQQLDIENDLACVVPARVVVEAPCRLRQRAGRLEHPMRPERLAGKLHCLECSSGHGPDTTTSTSTSTSTTTSTSTSTRMSMSTSTPLTA